MWMYLSELPIVWSYPQTRCCSWAVFMTMESENSLQNISVHLCDWSEMEFICVAVLEVPALDDR